MAFASRTGNTRECEKRLGDECSWLASKLCMAFVSRIIENYNESNDMPENIREYKKTLEDMRRDWKTMTSDLLQSVAWPL